jgi:hypothetical protein
MPSRGRGARWPSIAVVLLAGIAVTTVVLVARAVQPAVPSDPNVPFGADLVAAGLSWSPVTGAPTSQGTVERVLMDGAATYLQFSVAGTAGAPPDLPAPRLSADGGAWVNAATGLQADGPTRSLGYMPGWLPLKHSWIWHFVATYPGVPPLTTRHIEVTFAGGEQVEVPVDLRALRYLSVRHPRTTARADGLVFTLDAVGTRFITGTSDWLSAGSPTVLDAVLRVAGRRILLPVIDGDCSLGAQPGWRCTTTWAHPARWPGVRAVLTITQDLTGATTIGPTQRPILGPWTVPLTLP